MHLCFSNAFLMLSPFNCNVAAPLCVSCINIHSLYELFNGGGILLPHVPVEVFCGPQGPEGSGGLRGHMWVAGNPKVASSIPAPPSVEVSLSKAPNPHCSLTARSKPLSVCECVHERVNARQYCKAL